ncbi:uncharacterized protein AB675_5465 [Cyphellophora attinorum]|uniref:Uncharacterized protein n=1 Tax=Cyphellophora attinorum TaxID=1664694 RepID=A0A0N1HW85_9EURO|nr:uncharacterized protein AB675_5465 [Phialophora attinorum]KPI41803.1 hypothetical protein AB675_5465 [Phialophora attinorum]
MPRAKGFADPNAKEVKKERDKQVLQAKREAQNQLRKDVNDWIKDSAPAQFQLDMANKNEVDLEPLGQTLRALHKWARAGLPMKAKGESDNGGNDDGGDNGKGGVFGPDGWQRYKYAEFPFNAPPRQSLPVANFPAGLNPEAPPFVVASQRSQSQDVPPSLAVPHGSRPEDASPYAGFYPRPGQQSATTFAPVGPVTAPGFIQVPDVLQSQAASRSSTDPSRAPIQVTESVLAPVFGASQSPLVSDIPAPSPVVKENVPISTEPVSRRIELSQSHAGTNTAPRRPPVVAADRNTNRTNVTQPALPLTAPRGQEITQVPSLRVRDTLRRAGLAQPRFPLRFTNQLLYNTARVGPAPNTPVAPDLSDIDELVNLHNRFARLGMAMGELLRDVSNITEERRRVLNEANMLQDLHRIEAQLANTAVAVENEAGQTVMARNVGEDIEDLIRRLTRDSDDASDQ